VLGFQLPKVLATLGGMVSDGVAIYQIHVALKKK